MQYKEGFKISKQLKQWQAKVFDELSFSAIHLLHLRNSLDDQYRERFCKYIDSWRGATLDDYYAMPKAWRPMWAMRGQRRLIQVSPLATGYVENDTAHYDLYPCKAGWKAPTMLIAHGLMSVSDWGYRRWASRLNELGWNAVFVHLPYHYARRPRGKWSGELAITADLIRNVEGLRQCVIELRSLCDWLERQGCTEIGGWGTSYGGWILSVLGAVERRLKRVILVEPMINVESGIWSSPASRVIQRKLRQVGIKLSDAEPHFRLCCPRYMSLHCEPRDVLLVAGEYDEVTPAYEIEQLHRMWKGSHYACFPQGHVGYTLMPESFRLALNLWPEIWRK